MDPAPSHALTPLSSRETRRREKNQRILETQNLHTNEAFRSVAVICDPGSSAEACNMQNIDVRYDKRHVTRNFLSCVRKVYWYSSKRHHPNISLKGSKDRRNFRVSNGALITVPCHRLCIPFGALRRTQTTTHLVACMSVVSLYLYKY